MTTAQANFGWYQCSMASTKCTGADGGAFVGAGAGAVFSVHSVVCSVLPATYEHLEVETG